jgi:hypothetical protein
MGIGSWSYVGWEVPQFAICKQENQESLCTKIQSKAEALGIRGNNGCDS